MIAAAGVITESDRVFGRILLVCGLSLLILLLGGGWYLRSADRSQTDGEVALAVLDAPVRVRRDEQGIPYIDAENLADALRAQGYVTAQDRLFQIELTRYLSQGRLAELFGEGALASDRRLRIAGVPLHGRRHAALLDAEGRWIFERYLEGLNAYIRERREEHPVGLRLLGLSPQPWTLEDLLILQYFLMWSSSQNLGSELVSQAIVDRLGPERANEIMQLTVNPDAGQAVATVLPLVAMPVGLRDTGGWEQVGAAPPALGSNSWAVAPRRSASGAAMLANDPHVDARTLPGIWHPVGLATPEFRAIGVAGPGVPGLAIGRTRHIAFGVTNSYGDVIDLFIETPDPQDPERYLEGERSLPFEWRVEKLRVRDRSAPSGYREVSLRIRSTRRGPVISDHGMTLDDGRLISMRWSPPEDMRPRVGVDRLFLAKSVDEAGAVIADIGAPYNYTVVDSAGNIAHFTAGRVPIRRHGDGALPQPVRDGSDAWAGMIPAAEMPGQRNPERGWLGNANHRTLPADYPYAYSTYFAASWRYRRMLELLDGDRPLTAADHWRFMRDVRNTLAARIAPVMATALAADAETAELAALLRNWDYQDHAELAAPAVFQAVYRRFARLSFADDLGPELTQRMLKIGYYWHERLARMVLDGAPEWFDDRRTGHVETRDELFREAARLARVELEAQLGPDPRDWRWGDLHRVTFASPLVPGERAAALFGGGTRPLPGSGETLNRGIYPFEAPYRAKIIASLRFVADLGDPDRVYAVLPGGASGRQFDPHLKDQLDAWFDGEQRAWWFSDDAIAAHAVSELRLVPGAAGD